MKFIKSFGYLIISILVLTLVLTLLYYFNIIGTKTFNVFLLLIPVFSLLFSAGRLGNMSSEKGWLEGIKFGVIFVLVLIVLSLFGLTDEMNWMSLLYFLIIITSAVLGSMFGISKKKTDE